MFRASARLKAMGMASLYLALWGGLWMVEALNAQTWVWVVACVLLPASLLAVRAIGLRHAGKRVRAAEPEPSEDEQQAELALGRRFGLVFAVTIGVVALAANALSKTGRADWIVPTIGVFFGAHLFPLARVFDYPLYVWTGGFEVVVCAGLGLALRHHLLVAEPLFGLAMGLSLWMTVLVTLVQGAWLSARALQP